jgi:hypothetical protein
MKHAIEFRSGYGGDPWRELGCAIVRQAVEDIRELSAQRVIDKRGVPASRKFSGDANNKLLGYYRSEADVRMLVEFFRDRWADKLLDLVGMEIDSADICRTLLPEMQLDG